MEVQNKSRLKYEETGTFILINLMSCLPKNKKFGLFFYEEMCMLEIFVE